MRLTRLLFVALLIAAPASAQEWTDFTSKIDRFTVNLPGEPKAQDLKWESDYGAVFPGRVHSLAQGTSTYSITVIDYTDAEAIHAARPNRTEAETGGAYWQVPRPLLLRSRMS